MLISGAKNLHVIYPDNDEEARSRFIEKLIWREQLKTKDVNAVKVSKLGLDSPLGSLNAKISYKKTSAIKEYLAKTVYSHSKINTYLHCKLKFYFQYALGLEEDSEIGEELSGNHVGNFIHEFLENVFPENFKFEEMKKESFKKYYMAKLLTRFDAEFDSKFREDVFLIRRTVEHKMEKFLELLKTREFQFVYRREEPYNSKIQCKTGEYNLHCRIDRIDKTDTGYAIYDYKTGSNVGMIMKRDFDKILDSGFSLENIKKAIKSFQIPLYKYIFEKSTGYKVSECGIYDIRGGGFEEFRNDESAHEKCIEALKTVLDDINSGDSFEFDAKDIVKCRECKYFNICR